MPALCVIINDNPEGQLLSLVYDSAKAKQPCRMCRWVTQGQQLFIGYLMILSFSVPRRCPGELFSDPTRGATYPLRTTDATEQLRTKCSQAKAPAKHYKAHSRAYYTATVL